MSAITCKYCLCILTFVFMTGHSDIRTVATQILPDGSSSQIGLDDSQETINFSLSSSVSQNGIQMVHSRSQNGDRGGISRRKRNVLFPSGVKLCAQETVEQAIANHLDYFYLRVCQETVWEAFKIFWDRLPERKEYQAWMTMCREGRSSTFDIGANFSQSAEHVALVHSRIPVTGSDSEDSNSRLHMCSQTTAAPSVSDADTTQKEGILWPETATIVLTPEAAWEGPEVTAQEVSIGEEATVPAIQEVTLGAVHEVTLVVTPQTTAAGAVAGQGDEDWAEESTITNEIELDVLTRPPWSLREQMVELSVQLKGEMFSDALKDPLSFYYQRLAQRFTEKIEDAFERLPGFKNVAVLEFRSQRDAKGDSAVVVHYVVTLEVDEGISQETLDYITLQSNLLGNSYPELDEQPTVVYTITDFRNYITEALHKDSFIGNTTLAVDPNTLQLENVESLVPPESSDPSKSADAMGNILAAESLLNLPGQDLNNNDIVNSSFSKDDFLVDSAHSSDPWMGVQNVVASENDVIILDERPALPPPVLPDRTSDTGDLEEEGLLYGNKVVTTAAPADSLERGDITIEVTPGAAFPDIAGPAPEPPGGHGEKNTLQLLDTGSGSGLAGEELGPLWPVAAVEEGAASDGGMKKVEREQEDRLESAIQTEDGKEEGETEEILIDAGVHAAAGLVPTLSTHVLKAPGRHDDDVQPSTAVTQAATATLIIGPLATIANEPINVAPSGVDSNFGSNLAFTEAPIYVNVEFYTEEPAVGVFEQPVAHGYTNTPLSLEPHSNENAEGVQVFEAEEGAVPLVTESHSVEVSEEETPFYQPTPSPTAAVLGAKVPSNEVEEIIRITLTPAFRDPAMPSETHAPGDPAVIDSDHSFDVPHYGGPGFTGGEGNSGYPSGIAHGTDMAGVAQPNNGSSLGRALMVFFSLRVTNMMFSEDLFNKSSPEYKALEQRFLELLVPYLQSNLSNFQNLEILNFRNGSIVVNSRMKFGKPMPHGVTSAVYLILEDFCNTAYQTMNLAIDKYSLDVESGEQADPCKFQACNEFSECTVNRWSGEAECVCNAGYLSVGGLPCQSVCELRPDFCRNDGKCDIIPGQGAICRCRVGENWWYRGEHCEEYVSEPLVVGIAIASVAGFLLVASGVIFFLARTLRDQYDKDETEDPIRRGDSVLSLERATKYNPMFESDITTGYSHYYRRYPEMACYSSASAEASTDFSSEEIRHIYENSELTREEIQDRIRIIELYAKDRQFADFVRQHQVSLDIQRESSTT